tara:strand:- start:78 stop:641 length:564 start_codon:yes stop_codon:yes gene_type:complete
MPYPETIAYIKKQLEEGIKADKIKKALENAGYQGDVIDELMEKAGVEKEEKKVSDIEKILMKDAIIGVVLLLIIGSLGYFVFLDTDTQELFAPKTLKVDFKDKVLELSKDGSLSFDLGKYVKDPDYEDSEISWSFRDKSCVSVIIEETSVTLRSRFIPGCPEEENIVFKATNPKGDSASDVLKIKIV